MSPGRPVHEEAQSMATTISLKAAPSRSIGRSQAHAWTADLRIAGLALFSAGAILFMTIITAEALYPIAYTTGGNEISDLGGTRPLMGLVFQPSATIFNAGMVVSGLCVVLGAIVLQRAVRRWSVSLPVAVLGTAAVTVGIFPGNTGNPHAIAAMVAFISGGLAAVSTSRVVAAPFRYVLMLLGVVNLVMLASYFTLGDANPMWALGVGGAERWVAYPVILWLMGFGGYVAGRAEPQPGTWTSVPTVVSASSIAGVRASGELPGDQL